MEYHRLITTRPYTIKDFYVYTIQYIRPLSCIRWTLYMFIYYIYPVLGGTEVAQWLRCCATNRKVADSIRAGVSGFFIDIKSFRSHYGPGGRLSLYQKWVPGVFPGGKVGRCVRLTTYHNPVPLSWNLGTSTSRNLHHPSRPVGLLWTSDQLVAETSTWQHTTLTTDKYLCPRWDSNPRSQQASGRRPTP